MLHHALRSTPNLSYRFLQCVLWDGELLAHRRVRVPAPECSMTVPACKPPRGLLVSQVSSHILGERCAQLHSVGIGNEAGCKGVVEHKWLNSHLSTLRRHSEGMNFLGSSDLPDVCFHQPSCIGSTGLPIKWGGEPSGYHLCSISWSSQEQSCVWRMSLCVTEGCDSSLPLTAGRNVAEYFAPSRNVYGIVEINVSPRACIFMGNQAQMVHLHSPGLLETLAPTSLCAHISLKCLSLWPNLHSLYVEYRWTGKR